MTNLKKKKDLAPLQLSNGSPLMEQICEKRRILIKHSIFGMVPEYNCSEFYLPYMFRV